MCQARQVCSHLHGIRASSGIWAGCRHDAGAVRECCGHCAQLCTSTNTGQFHCCFLAANLINISALAYMCEFPKQMIQCLRWLLGLREPTFPRTCAHTALDASTRETQIRSHLIRDLSWHIGCWRPRTQVEVGRGCGRSRPCYQCNLPLGRRPASAVQPAHIGPYFIGNGDARWKRRYEECTVVCRLLPVTGLSVKQFLNFCRLA
ncbi:hypothetical protein FA95DRAFT_93022 [Auriscalpium vulgare]|uniref:Uncharacterized protein n=1 Tax=Auriscalpium vulgare TaxID=40419 RepID=A0ACB8RP85_9AGAM|nr:hypothetical protein FA95DRAFT_93022 [Auriscalpium vulgare]